jgi:hypothetical protein
MYNICFSLLLPINSVDCFLPEIAFWEKRHSVVPSGNEVHTNQGNIQITGYWCFFVMSGRTLTLDFLRQL